MTRQMISLLFHVSQTAFSFQMYYCLSSVHCVAQWANIVRIMPQSFAFLHIDERSYLTSCAVFSKQLISLHFTLGDAKRKEWY